MPNVNFGIIGLGTIGKMHAKVLSNIDGACLRGVADINASAVSEIGKLYNCKGYSDFEEMLEDDNINAVSVCLPSGMHNEAVIKAANANKHVIVEKPLEINIKRAENMIAVCRKKNVKLGVILQHRFDDSIMQLKNAVASGILGDLLFGTAKTIWYRDHEYFSKSTWKGTFDIDGGGALINQSIHYIDLLRYIMGPVEKVCGKCANLYHKSIEVEDTGIALLVFENGALGSIEGTTLAYPGLSSDLNIFGTNGTVCIKNDRLDFYSLKTGHLSEFDAHLSEYCPMPTGASKAEDLDICSHKKQYEDFINSINENRDPLVTGEEGIKSLALIDAIYKSSSKQEWVQPLY